MCCIGPCDAISQASFLMGVTDLWWFIYEPGDTINPKCLAFLCTVIKKTCNVTSYY